MIIADFQRGGNAPAGRHRPPTGREVLTSARREAQPRGPPAFVDKALINYNERLPE